MKITVKNRLAAFLRMKGLRSASQFARLMTEAGFPMSRSHATRYEREDMPATDLRFINAACNVLQCLPHSLYDYDIELEPSEELDPTLHLPPHAVIRRVGTASTVTPPRPEVAVAPVVSQPFSPPSVPAAKPKAKPRPFDMDTGPQVTVFPYGKK